MPEKMPESPTFCLKIDFEKSSPNPSRVFKAAYGLIDTFQFIDRTLVTVVDNRIEPTLMLEDVKSGSLKIWLANKFEAVPDDAIYHLDWKPIIGQYLLQAKYYIVDFLKGTTQITNIQDIKPLMQRISTAAEKTDLKWLKDYKNPDPKELLEGMQQLSDDLAHLGEHDKALYIMDNEEVEFNLTFKMSPESLQILLQSEQITNELEQILKVKKPDYLGDSQWELRFGSKNILATIDDKEWIAKFQSKKVKIEPGDAIRVKMKETQYYDYNREVTGTSYEITQVLDIIPGGKQFGLFGNDMEDIKLIEGQDHPDE